MEEKSGLESFSDILETAVTGVPAPIRKNFWKAFGQLCTAAVDVPVAYLEGKADEFRAVAAARRSILEKGGQGLAENMQVPQEYADKAAAKYIGRILKEQINIDQIVQKAAKQVQEEGQNTASEKTESTEEISDDWLQEFESIARLKSSEDMQEAFAKILCGEILKPGRFSIRSIRLMSQLDNHAANAFQRLVSCTFQLEYKNRILDQRVFAMGTQPAANGLRKYGLSFSDLNVLHEYGLIIGDYNSYNDYSVSILREKNFILVPIVYGKSQSFAFKMKNEKGAIPEELRVHGIAYSKAGKELFSVVTVEPNMEYLADVLKFYSEQSLQLVPIKLEN